MAPVPLWLNYRAYAVTRVSCLFCLPFGKLRMLGSMVLDYLLCADFGAERQNPRTIIEKYRSAEGENADRVSPVTNVVLGGAK